LLVSAWCGQVRNSWALNVALRLSWRRGRFIVPIVACRGPILAVADLFLPVTAQPWPASSRSAGIRHPPRRAEDVGRGSSPATWGRDRACVTASAYGTNFSSRR
jgi:hypothetical protein